MTPADRRLTAARTEARVLIDSASTCRCCATWTNSSRSRPLPGAGNAPPRQRAAGVDQRELATPARAGRLGAHRSGQRRRRARCPQVGQDGALRDRGARSARSAPTPWCSPPRWRKSRRPSAKFQDAGYAAALLAVTGPGGRDRRRRRLHLRPAARVRAGHGARRVRRILRRLGPGRGRRTGRRTRPLTSSPAQRFTAPSAEHPSPDRSWLDPRQTAPRRNRRWR